MADVATTRGAYVAAITHHIPPEPGVTEIRVHGVGGATPESLLEQTGVRQVTGDDKAGMFRGQIPVPGRTVEAYSWGGLTARSKSRAFWVLLLPFSLVNLAGWMVEPKRNYSSPSEYTSESWRRSRGTKWHEVFVQLIGVTTTAMYVMWAALIAMNSVAFQCGAVPACRKGRWYMEPFNASYFIDHPGRRIVLALLVPIGLLAFFWFLGRMTRSRYDDFMDADHARISSDAGEEAGSVIAQTSFWHTSQWQSNLARIHIAVVLLILAGLLGRAAIEFQKHFGVDVTWVPEIPSWWALVPTGLLALAACAAMILATWRSGPVLGERVEWLGVVSLWILRVSMLFVLAAAVVAFQLQFDGSDARLIEATETLSQNSTTESAPGVSVAGSSPTVNDGTPRPDTDLWGFGWAPILLLALSAVFIFGFSVTQLWRWIRWRMVLLDQFMVPLMFFFVVLWPWATWLSAVLIVAGAVVHFGITRLADKQAPGDASGWRFALFVAVWVVAGVVAWATRDLSGPYGVDWPRVTPMLLFTVILIVVNLAQSFGKFNAEGVTASVKAPLALVWIPAGIVIAGMMAQGLSGRPEWYAGSAMLAMVVMSVVWLAQYRFDGWRWNGPAAVALTALAIVMGAFSGIVIWLVDILDRDGSQFALRATGIYEWLAVSFAVMLIAIVGGFVAWYVLVRFGITRKGDDAKLAADEVLPEAIKAIDVVLTVAAVLLVSGVIALVVHLNSIPDAGVADWIDNTPPGNWRGIVQVASWIALGVGVGAFFVVRSGLKDQAFRKRFGILWDVASFWPRSFHPFAPPAYSVRAVPEIQARVTETVEASGGSVILSGHSQGSVISLAAVSSLKPGVVPAVRLVTHGAPINRFYHVFFPRYFPDSLLEFCAGRVGPTEEIADGGWLNFWRRTDPIGAPVFGARRREPPQDAPSQAERSSLSRSASKASQLPDVLLYDPFDSTSAYQPTPRARGHSGYMADPAMSDTLTIIASEFPNRWDPADHVVLVDRGDRTLDLAGKLAAHTGDGQLHRAVSVFLSNSDGLMLIQKRSVTKAHFGGKWANTCCTHPRPGELPLAAAARALDVELGLQADLTELGAFVYRTEDRESGSVEHEFDHVFRGVCDVDPTPNPDEVEQWDWVSLDRLRERLEREPDAFAPWLSIALQEVPLLGEPVDGSRR